MTEVSKKAFTFKDLLEQKQWTDYGSFVSESPALLSKEIDEYVRGERQIADELREHPEFKKLDIRKVKERLKKAEDALRNGNVVGVDGTRAQYRLVSGIRCQIGVVAVNYAGEKIRHSFFISEADLREEPSDVLDRVAKRAFSEDSLSDFHIRGLMLYREREAGLHEKFKGKYIMFHGSMLPFELMSGLGRLRALDITLDVLRRIVREKRFFSIVSSTAYQDYLTFGMAIGSGEYFTAKEYTLGDHLIHSSAFLGYKEKWRHEEYEKIEKFLRDYGEKICIGVIRTGQRPYVFHAHKETFDIAAAIIARDSMFQGEKGFPLLIDYADSLCSQYFSAREFKAMVEWELSKRGRYLADVPERDLRRK